VALVENSRIKAILDGHGDEARRFGMPRLIREWRAYESDPSVVVPARFLAGELDSISHVGGRNMSTAAMQGATSRTSPGLKSRIAGVLNLLAILTGIFASFLSHGRLGFEASFTQARAISRWPCSSMTSSER